MSLSYPPRASHLACLCLLTQAFASSAFAWSPSLPRHSLSLSILNWTLISTNGSVSVPTKFPYQAHLALLDAGVISEPNVGLNEGLVRWVGEEELWTWNAPLEQLGWQGVDEYFLVFNGLDTFCNVSVNDRQVGYANNAFRVWIFNITEAFAPDSSNSSLTLKFASSYLVGGSFANDPNSEKFPRVNEPGIGMATTSDRYEYDYRNWVRTAQNNFGWDWGPAYLPTGPNKDAYLIGLSSPAKSKRSLATLREPWITDPSLLRIRDDPRPALWNEAGEPASNEYTTRLVAREASPFFLQRTFIDIYKKGQKNNYAPDMNVSWIVNITLPLVSSLSSSNFKDALLSISLANTSVSFNSVSTGILKPLDYAAGINFSLTATVEISKDAVEMWWPATLGKPHLYVMDLQLDAAGETLMWQERVGFRTIRVNQERFTDEEVALGFTPGTHFQFEINGQPFFVQGSSLIPLDTMLQRVNESTIRWILESAVLAHQNTVRIWGGGIYASDEFYEACDEIGIIAWSEAIYACGAYPVTDDFIDNARAELADNVQRINKHPSVGLWATNNEGEGYLSNVNKTRPNGTIYFDQYNWFNNNVLRYVILQNTRSLSFLPSSTTNGYLYMDDTTYISRYSNATPGEMYGDKELYNYDATVSFNVSTYPVARFINEFGFHSMPSIYTWDRVLTDEASYDFNSSVVRAHDKHTPASNLSYPWPANEGQSQMTVAVETYFPRPNITGDARRLLAQWAYSTQIFQGMYMASEISYYRLGASRGERNMGACYWQLNDIWEGSTWASIEYTGRWKPFHYFAQRTQDRVIISPFYNINNQTLDIYVTSDLWEATSGIAKWTWYDFTGKLLSATTAPFAVGALNSTKLFSKVGLDHLIPHAASADDAWLHLEVSTGCKNEGNCAYYNEQFWQPLPLSESKLRESKIEVRGVGGNRFELSVKGGVAPWVNVEHPPGVKGHFASTVTGKPSNNFYLRPGETRVLEFKVFEDTTDRQFAYGLTARSIWNNQH